MQNKQFTNSSGSTRNKQSPINTININNFTYFYSRLQNTHQMIIFEKKGIIAYITLNRPEKYNSINQELALAIQSAFDDCAEDKSIRAIVLSGTGKAFCAGQDLGASAD